MNTLDILQTLCRAFPQCNAREFTSDYAEELKQFPEFNVYVDTINTAKTEQQLRGAQIALGGMLMAKRESMFRAQRVAGEATANPNVVTITAPKNGVRSPAMVPPAAPAKLSKKARAKLGMQPGEATTAAHREAYAKMHPQSAVMPVAPQARQVAVPTAEYVPPSKRKALRDAFFFDARRVTGTQTGITEKADVLMKADMKAVSLVSKHNVVTAGEVMDKHRNIIFANPSSKAVYLAYLKAEMSANVALDAIKRTLSAEHQAEKRAA